MKETPHLDSCFLETLLEFHFIALVKLQQDVTQLNLTKQISKAEANQRQCEPVMSVKTSLLDFENSSISYKRNELIWVGSKLSNKMKGARLLN